MVTDMTTLLEALQKRLGQAGTAQPAPTGQQQQLTQALQAGTGKAGSQGAVSPRQSSLAEQATIATVDQQQLQQQQQTQAAIQAIGQQSQEIKQQEQLATERLQAQREQTEGQLESQKRVQQSNFAFQEEQAKAQRDAQTYIRLNALTQKADQALQQLTTQRGVKLDDLFANYNRQQAELELKKAESELHQKIFALTLANKKYMDEIALIGDRRRLNSAMAFQREAQEMIWGESVRQLREQFDWLRSEDIKQRNFELELSNMGIRSRMAVYDMMMQANQTQFYSQAIGNVGQAATAYYTRPSNTSATDTTSTNTMKAPTTQTYPV
jgi:hypothetical protein